MSLSQRIATALADPRVGPAPHTVSAAQGPHTLTLSLQRHSPVGVELDGLSFRVGRMGSGEYSLDELTAWADRVARQVTYLMEDLVLIEADATGVEVELRSQKPTARHDQRLYYEARLDRTGCLRLSRVRFDESTRRRSETPFQLTSETLERLTDDLVATAPRH